MLATSSLRTGEGGDRYWSLAKVAVRRREDSVPIDRRNVRNIAQRFFTER